MQTTTCAALLASRLVKSGQFGNNPAAAAR